ncbi:acyltransferase [Caulobacter sp. X]|uniref:acyltransferase family protein n=1 Tax=Caulobacter sp. X TaxID=2048901 RepID=UPI001374749F|nr:acyltransferase [Caulobacter sp. X]
MRDLSPAPPHSHRRLEADIARGLAIILVVIGHALEILFYNRPDGGFSEDAFALWRLIYAGHIPAFFVIAGLVSPSRNLPAPTRAHQLVGLALAAHLAIALPLAALQLTQHPRAATTILVQALRPLILGTGFSAPSLWFLIALAGVETVWRRTRAKVAVLVLTILVLTAVALVVPRAVPNLWSFRDLGPGLTFYALGAALKRVRGRRLAQACAFALGAWVWAAASNKGCYLPKEGWCPLPGMGGRFGPLMALGAFGDYRLFLLSGASAAVALLGAGAVLARTPAREALGWVGRRSLDLYLVNGAALALANPVLKGLPMSPNVLTDLVGLMVVMVSLQVFVVRLTTAPLSRFRAWAFRLTDRLKGPGQEASALPSRRGF